ncbi:MAG: hypothetical protein R3C19_05240 [Planctomycetaceae bacterium]
MPIVRKKTQSRSYHANAYQFVFAGLRYAQEHLGRDRTDCQTGHVSGRELLEGVRALGLQHYGLMASSVFANWGVHCTEDFGRIVFELIEAGEMRKTDDDQLSDFVDVFDFRTTFLEHYDIDTSTALKAR